MSTKKLKRIKTGALERRLAITLSGAKAGSALMLNRASTVMMNKDAKEKSRSLALTKQAEKFTRELGELKGSYVKIGQMLALFGDHLLRPELTNALHSLDYQTTPVCWEILEAEVVSALGSHIDELDIDPAPLASASLGQVHRGVIRSSGEQICLKILYPGVKASIDNDFNDVIRLLKLANWLEKGSELNGWLEEIKALLHQEVDYLAEAEKTDLMRERIAGDKRFVIPKVYHQYSSGNVLALEYLAGFEVTDSAVLSLPQERRNYFAQSMLDLFFKEVFQWSVLQTDPNFGNYRIQLADEHHSSDRLVLLDFGAVREYPESFLSPLQQIIIGAHHESMDEVIEGAVALKCINVADPQAVKEAFAQFCMSLLEPMRQHFNGVPDYALTADGVYRWRDSRLMKRVGKQATQSAISRHFMLPPKEFSLIVRKLTGVFSFISVIGGQFNGYPVIHRYAVEQEVVPAEG